MNQTHSMKPRPTRIVLLASALIFAFLFSEKSLGVNLMIYEVIVLGWLFFSRQFSLDQFLQRVLISGQIVTLLFTVWHHSTWSYFIHFVISALTISAIIAPEMRSLVYVGAQACSNLIGSYRQLFQKGDKELQKKKGFFFTFWKILRIILLPLVIIGFFLFLYSLANPTFGWYVHKIFDAIDWFFTTLFDALNFPFVFTMLFGCIIGVYIFYRRSNRDLLSGDAAASDKRIRTKSRHKGFRVRGLLQEFRSGIFLFAVLNLALLLLNVLDIYHVWINFRWEGQYLSDFVHQGTYSLIFAIILSVILVLYYFNGNPSFFSKNKNLKLLCYIWLGQNIFLALSTGLRNWYYIEYYSLAYKRIAVAFFIILAIYGLYSVIVKIRHTKSAYYVLRKNAMVWMLVLTISAGFNWDRIIASYNFSQRGHSFVHLNFLSVLSDSALPELEQPMSVLSSIQNYQETVFFSLSDFSSESYRGLYLDADQYAAIIEERKWKFKRKWEKKSWLEWNYAEARAYHTLFP